MMESETMGFSILVGVHADKVVCIENMVYEPP